MVVHDELDLPPGTVRVKDGGGLAGHNGLRSLTAAPQDQRVPPGAHRRRQAAGGKEHGADHVLRKPAKAERDASCDVDASQEAADAVEPIGIERRRPPPMTRYNAR